LLDKLLLALTLYQFAMEMNEVDSLDDLFAGPDSPAPPLDFTGFTE
jgi:hypothetical protein